MIRRKKSQTITERAFPFWVMPCLVILSLLILQCSIEKPAAPTWNVKLSVPLVSRHYDMATLIEKIDEPYLKVDSLGNPGFYFEEELDTIRLVDRLRCDSTSVSFKDTLGVIDINTSESREILIQVTDFYTGDPGFVPPCSATIEEDLDTFSNFSHITASEAFATLTISNHLSLDLALVQVKIIDRAFSNTLHTELLTEGVDDGDSISQEIVLIDKTFSNSLGFEIKILSPGGEILTFEDKYLLVGFSLDSMRVTEGRAKVPSFELSDEEEILLPTSSIIDSAIIKSGQLSLHLDNLTNLQAVVRIHFPEIQKDGHDLSTLSNLLALGSSDLTLALDGYTLRPEEGNKATAQVTVWTPGSEEALVDFHSSDSVSAEITLSEVIFSQVSGIIESTLVEIGPIERALELPPAFELAHLTNASLYLEIHNGVDLPADLSLIIEGDQGQNLSLHAQVEAGGPFGTAVTSVFEDELESLLNPVPQSLTITGEIIYGDGQSHGIVREEDFVFGVLEVSSPWELILDSCQVQIDADSDQVEDDVREMIEDQINFGKVVLKAESHLPIGAEARILFSRNQESLFLNPDLVIGPVNVAAGELDYDGSVKESNFSEIEISLTHQELQVFTGTPFYMAGTIDFPGTDGESIKALSTDYIKITSYLELNVKNKRE